MSDGETLAVAAAFARRRSSSHLKSCSKWPPALNFACRRLVIYERRIVCQQLPARRLISLGVLAHLESGVSSLSAPLVEQLREPAHHHCSWSRRQCLSGMNDLVTRGSAFHTEICYDIRISMTMKAIERAEVLQEGCCERICDVAHYKAGCRITAYLQIPV